jgi:hypothetical protein
MDTPKFVRETWSDYEKACFVLADTLQKSGENIDTIVAISRGGLVVARILSDLLDKPISHITISTYLTMQQSKEPFIDEVPSKAFTNQTILIVDEICDTGKTLQRAVEYFSNFSIKKAVTGVPYVKPKASYKPTYSSKSVDGWIIFPYEVRETFESMEKIFQSKEKALQTMKVLGFEEWELSPFMFVQ